MFLRALLFSCGLLPVVMPGAACAQDEDVAATARAALAALQPQSFSTGDEYCGFVARDSDGGYLALVARRGDQDTCTPFLPEGWEAVASYHTHAGHSPEHDAEVPSVLDLRADHDEGTNGYISTPGGRLWFVDGARKQARLICGPGCMPADPGYDARDHQPVKDSYSYMQLRRRERMNQ